MPLSTHSDGPDSTSPSFRDPQYVATVVGVLASAAVAVYAALVPGPPTPETAIGVLLAVTLPVTVAYELAKRVR